MLLPDFKDFPRTGRILGIDWGAKRIGYAISDERQEFVFPRENADYNVAGIVVGLPLRSDGTDSETTRRVREFAATLPADLPVVFLEENLTSVAAEEYTKDKKKLDSIAAAMILENALAVIKRDIGHDA